MSEKNFDKRSINRYIDRKQGIEIPGKGDYRK
jgi:hypothetical protein